MNHKMIIGHFGSAYGVKGWLKVNSATDPIENILNYLPWQVYHQGLWSSLTITAGKKQGKYILVKIEGCDTPETAKTYTNDSIAIEREQLPALPSNEYYWSDLIGLSVINQDGINFGHVKSLLATGSNDVLVVKNSRQRLIPYTEEVIKKVDIANKLIEVIWDPDF